MEAALSFLTAAENTARNRQYPVRRLRQLPLRLQPLRLQLQQQLRLQLLQGEVRRRGPGLGLAHRRARSGEGNRHQGEKQVTRLPLQK
jgi:hypothetical protein